MKIRTNYILKNNFKCNFKCNFLKQTLVLAIIILSFLILPSNVLSIGIGVTPGGLNFENVLKNGYAEKIMYISITETNLTEVSYEITGDLEDWVFTDQENDTFIVEPTTTFPLKIMVMPPDNIANGIYKGNIRFLSGKLTGLTGGGSGSAVKAGIMFPLTVEITGNEIKSCSVPKFTISNVERGEDIQVEYILKNSGNVRSSPLVELVVWDQLQQNIIEILSFNMEETLPTVETRNFVFLENNLDLGQYWVDAYVNDCNFNKLYTFNVFDKGEIHDSGILVSIENVPAGIKDDIISINAFFTNTGQRSVDAIFKGRVELDGKIVDIIESDIIRVNPGVTEKLVSYFKPESEGVYYVFGRVHYNNKLTFERQGVLNIFNEMKQYPYREFNVYNILLLLIIILIFFFITKIIREEKKKKKA